MSQIEEPQSSLSSLSNLNLVHPSQLGEGITLVVTHNGEWIPELITGLATLSPIRVYTADRRLPASEIIRLVRRQMLNIDEMLERIEVTRIARCYQLAKLSHTIPDEFPLLFLHLLSIFHYEEVAEHECVRLLHSLLNNILQLQSPIIMTVRAPIRPEDEKLMTMLEEAAAYRFEQRFLLETKAAPVQMGLF
ncbi:MAG: hypothetical protein AAF902_00885 [Chloroflexota bacterium]